MIASRQTQQSIARFCANPSHALLLVGPVGAGKKALADHVILEVVGTTGLDSVLNVESDKAIGIEEIRNLQHFLQLKRPGKAEWRRAVKIVNADSMTTEAQNALLKSLEEPPADTLFVLTARQLSGLKATIRSRVQVIPVKPLSLAETETAYRIHHTGADITKAYHLSGGYADLLDGLLNQPEHPLVQSVNQAKQLLQATQFERLVLIDQLAKDKDRLPLVLYALRRVVSAVLANGGDQMTVAKLIATAKAIYQAEIDLQRNANPKLVLCDLLLSL